MAEVKKKKKKSKGTADLGCKTDVRLTFPKYTEE